MNNTNSRTVIREAKRKAATLENFEEVMERTGGEGGAQRKVAKTDGGEGGSATKLHRLLEMFKVGAVFRLFRRKVGMNVAACCCGRSSLLFYLGIGGVSGCFVCGLDSMVVVAVAGCCFVVVVNVVVVAVGCWPLILSPCPLPRTGLLCQT